MIHIAGFRWSFPVATYLAYLYEQQGRACRLIDGMGLLGTVSAFGAGHCLIAISFAPYTEQTVSLMQHAKKAGVEVVAISDCQDSPIFPLADHRLEVHEERARGIRTLTATFALTTTLVVAVGAETLEG